MSEDVVQTSPSALYYFTEADPSVFQRILFPVLFRASGASGSEWISEAVISNPRPWFVQNFNDVTSIVCLIPPCGELLAPASRQSFEGSGYPSGVALLTPHEEADDLAFSLRVRDVSREAGRFGVEIPVVREADMFRGTMTLLNVPLDPRHRTLLRVYAFDVDRTSDGRSIRFRTVRADGTSSVAFAELQSECAGCADRPYFAAIQLPPASTTERVDLYIELPNASLGWAFASVTDNVTQEVGIVTPNGRGGTPHTTGSDGRRNVR